MRYVVFLVAFLGLTSCAVKVPLKPDYYTSKSRVGLILAVGEIDHWNSIYGGGLIGYAAVAASGPGSKYEAPLLILQPQLNPTEKLRSLYVDAFGVKGKKLESIDEKFDRESIKALKEFTTDKTDRKYYKKDLRYLKEKYQMDEVLIVTVHYGIYSNLTYGVETSRSGATYIYPEIIDLKDNFIVYKGRSAGLIPIKGEWKTPPAYENLKNGIQLSIDKAIAVEREKYK